MKILVTGGNGFLGSHIVNHCIANNNSLFVVSKNFNRLNSILSNITFKSVTINEITTIKNDIIKFNPDIVIHCAWDGGNNYNDTHSANQFYNNIPGLIQLLDILKYTDVKKFIGIGTGSEYGVCNKKVLESDIGLPNSLYGACKSIAKIYSELICNIEKINWNWIRPMYIYGPNDISTRLIPKIIISCLKSEEINLNKCESIIDYLYIDDFVDAIYKLINNTSNGIYNICSSEEYLVKNIIIKIHNMVGHKNIINFGQIPERTNYPTYIVGSNEKIKSTVNWNPIIHIEEGLYKTIEFYKKL